MFDQPQDEESLLKAASKQPISVGICASAAMQFYAGGVLDKVGCSVFFPLTFTHFSHLRRTLVLPWTLSASVFNAAASSCAHGHLATKLPAMRPCCPAAVL